MRVQIVRFHLCKACGSRFGKHGAIENAVGVPCHICNGALSHLPQLAHAALQQAREFEWGTFSVSSSFPKAALVREQEVADLFAPGAFTSLKNSANASLAGEICRASGKGNDQRKGEAIFEIDFGAGKTSAHPSPLFIFGHYLKLSRKHCQSRWHCSECRGRGCPECSGSGMNYPSVEDELGKVVMAEFGAKGCMLHASGREDVDVRALGTGRPFVMELRSPAKRSADLDALEQKLSASQAVRATGLRIVGKHFIEAVCTSHFEKEYSALVSADRPLTQRDAEAVQSLSGGILRQQTPKRVLSRRADMERRRKIINIRASAEEGGKLRLEILAEAGTYIKELINSDGGRTRPSISELLGCSAMCEELDVIAIHDYFLETISD